MPQPSVSKTAKGTWVTYRPDIKILDCTVRDGGLINDHMFEDGFVKAIYDTCVAAGIDYMELGYKADRKIFGEGHGRWKFCDEDDLRRVVGDNPAELKLSVMADAERTDYKRDILPREKSVIGLVRVASYIHQIPAAIDMIMDAHEKGYETAFNLMALSTVSDRDLIESLEAIAQTPVSAVYVVDSFGSLYSEQIHYYIQTFQRCLEGSGKQIGIHTHNNMQLAYANTIEAVVKGANWLDATVAGIGRGAGNCPLELLISFLRNPKFRLRPVLQCLHDVMEPLKSQMEWGFALPYMVTGQLNRHPGAAIKMLDGQHRDDIVGFYDRMIEEE